MVCWLLSSFHTSRREIYIIQLSLTDLNLYFLFSLLRQDTQTNSITPEDKLTVLCEITIDGKDVQQSGQAPGVS